MVNYTIQFKRKIDRKWKPLEIMGGKFKTDMLGEVEVALQQMNEIAEKDGVETEVKVKKGNKITKRLKLPK